MTDSLFDKFMIRIVGEEPSISKPEALPKSSFASLLAVAGGIIVIVPALLAMIAQGSLFAVALTFGFSLVSSLTIISMSYVVQYLYDIRNLLLRQWERARA